MNANTSLTSPRQLLDSLSYWQQATPNSPALCWQEQVISYADFYASVINMADGLSRHLSPASRIAVLSYNCPQYAALLYAVPASGHVLLPLNVRLSAAEIYYQLTHAEADFLIVESSLLDKLKAYKPFADHVLPVLSMVGIGDDFDAWIQQQDASIIASHQRHNTDPDQLAWLLFTSGTTAKPKAAMLSQTGLLAALDSGAKGRPVEPSDCYLYPFPLFHVSAHNVLLQHRYGACVVLLKSFDAKAVIHCCRVLPITTMSLAPTMIRLLVDHPDFNFEDLTHIRTIGYGASPIPADLLQRLLTHSDVGLCQGYGMTELSGSIAFLDAPAHREALSTCPHRLQSVGKVVDGVDVKITHEGEIAVKSKQVMLGYWRQEQETELALVDGWLLTGDMGHFDEDGFLYLVDRKKDMIISGGENIASREVEDVLSLHPQVKQVAVVGCEDDRWGEAVTAFVQLKTHANTTEEALKSYCRERLAGYKVPKYIYYVDTLEANANGKVNKQALRLVANKRCQ